MSRLKIYAVLSVSLLFLISGCSGKNAEGAGNTTGNISNTAYVAEQGGFIYYATDVISKVNANGTEPVKISNDLASHINVADGWVYYSNKSDLHKLYKVRTDGTGTMGLNDDVSTFINVAGDWIYYVNESAYRQIFKIKTDGNLRTSVGTARASDLLAQGDWLYYINIDDRSRLYKIRTDGSEIVKVIDVECRNINISGNWIYYTFVGNGGIYKIRTDGSGAARVTADKSDGINLSGNWIFYSNLDDGGTIYKVKTDGGGRSKLNEDKSTAINIAGNWVYYKRPASAAEPDTFYKIRQDGNGFQKVQEALIAQMPTAEPNKTPIPTTVAPPDPTEEAPIYTYYDPGYVWTPAPVQTLAPATPPPTSARTPVPVPTPPDELYNGMTLAKLRIGDTYDRVLELYGKEDSRYPMFVSSRNYTNITYLYRGIEILLDPNTDRITRIKIVSPSNENFLALGIQLGSGIQDSIATLRSRYAFLRIYEGLVSGTKHYRFYAQYAGNGYLEMMSNPSDAQIISYIQIMNFDIGFPLSSTP